MGLEIDEKMLGNKAYYFLFNAGSLSSLIKLKPSKSIQALQKIT